MQPWLIVGGTPRLPGGGNKPSESTLMDLAKLVRRFPDIPLICGHSGGDWELGARAIRPHKNFLLEFAGSWGKEGDQVLVFCLIQWQWARAEGGSGTVLGSTEVPGIRIYPGYQPFELDHPGMEGLVQITAEGGLILQVVFGMEDARVHHPIISVSSVTLAPLLKISRNMPNAKIQ